MANQAKYSLRELKIQHPGEWFESPMDRIRISIPKSEKNWNRSAIRIPLKEETLDLYSEKKWHFCPCFEYFLASSISDKNEDKVQNLLKQLVPGHFELIYYIKNGSKEAVRISFPENYKKPNVKGDSNPLSRDSNSNSRMSRKWIQEAPIRIT